VVKTFFFRCLAGDGGRFRHEHNVNHDIARYKFNTAQKTFPFFVYFWKRVCEEQAKMATKTTFIWEANQKIFLREKKFWESAVYEIEAPCNQSQRFGLSLKNIRQISEESVRLLSCSKLLEIKWDTGRPLVFCTNTASITSHCNGKPRWDAMIKSDRSKG